MDVIVIGGGVIGCAIAWELATRGASVRLFDQRQIGAGASWASAGVLCPWIEGNLTSLTPMLAESSAMYEKFLAQLSRATGAHIEFGRGGSLEVAFTDDELARFDAISANFAGAGIPHARLTGAETLAREPALGNRVLGSLHVAAHGHVDVPGLTTALATAAQRAGAQLHVETPVTGVDSSGSRMAVRSAHNEWGADAVVLAAGAWSTLMQIDGAPAMPVKPIRGQLLRFRAATIPTHSLWSSAGYLVPWRDGTVLVGATQEDVGFDERTTDDAIAALRACAEELVPSLRGAAMMDARAGLRPVSADKVPIIGRSSRVPGLVYATGHGRNGIMLAPITASLVSDLLLEGHSGNWDALVSPARFGL